MSFTSHGKANMEINWLLAWWNLVFLVPLALALVYLGVYTVSGLTFGDTDVDADADADADVDADAHVDAEVDADADADHDVDADHDADADSDSDHDGDSDADHPPQGGGGWSMAHAAHWLGVGQVPLSTLLMILLMFWGFIGFTVNQLFRELIHLRGAIVASVSLPLAAIGTAVLTHAIAGLVHRVMPNVQTDVRKRSQLLGETGQALFPIDERFGMAAVRDDRGNLYQVNCCVGPGMNSLPKGEKVRLVNYDSSKNTFHVVAADA